jgi:hypothetical protein
VFLGIVQPLRLASSINISRPRFGRAERRSALQSLNHPTPGAEQQAKNTWKLGPCISINYLSFQKHSGFSAMSALFFINILA